ncbi:O-antigen ligase family protein [Rubripirellula reticaptiva]|uniref:O-Antigen ligase n=1 Tax=Rubripirellula reticaptiva TaxID=2528013 RepID=A0A5C6EKH7_9BACT|nr:O-antigen ligase family protein [Rubripirellula reticaptiva]TWU48106.1 O-Antigen ligase [Rubripirellula reticaptiva]
MDSRLQQSPNDEVEPRWIESIAAWIGRATILVALVYAMWRYGAVESLALRDLSILLIAASVLAMIKQLAGRRAAPIPMTLFLIAIAWIGYAFAQSVPSPSWIPNTTGWSQTIFAAENLQVLSDTIPNYTSQELASPPRPTASIIPSHTQQAIVPFLLATMMLVTSAVLFDSKRSRAAYLWVLMINAAAICIWGIVQRAGGDEYILPGVVYDVDGAPFSSFIYKNAGAAAILPTLGMIAALVIYRADCGPDDNIGHQAFERVDLFSTRFLTLISLAIFVMVGLGTSLSRGAWVAGAGAAIGVLLIRGRAEVHRTHVVACVVGCLAIAGVISISGVLGDVWERAEDVSITRLANDQRWSHTSEGWRAAVANLPFGSGLGTYGYATLPHQKETHTTWFRNAHNQYLETLTEMGLVGTTLVILGILVTAITSIRMIRNNPRPQGQTWGMIGLFTLLCCVIQSIYDFVIVIPSNMLLYASVIAIGIAVHKQSIASTKPRHFGFTGFVSVVVLAGLTIAAGVWAHALSQQQIRTDLVLAQTRYAETDDAPSAPEITDAIAKLDQAILEAPMNADLYKTRANWRLCEFRLAVIELAAQQNVTIDWQNSRLTSLFDIVISSELAQRDQVRNDFLATPELKTLVGQWMGDVDASLRRQPLSPRNHLAAAMMAPMTEQPTAPWIQSASRLINNSDEMLFINGWMAAKNGQIDEAIDQWKRSLSISLLFVDEIYERSQGLIGPIQIAENLIPPRRTDLFLRLINQSPEASESDRIKLAEKVVEILEAKEGVDDGLRFETIARIYQAIKRNDEATEAWKTAVSATGRNLEYRHRYSLALRATGKLQLALDQASLASAIDPRDPRFPPLVEQLRREIGGGRSIR